MARREEIVDVPNDDEAYQRDAGKRFVIKEMPALQADKWATRVLLALSRAGADIGMIQGYGVAGLQMAGIQSLPNLNFEDAEPLMDEMIPYMRFLPPAAPTPDWDHALPIILNTKDGDGDTVQEIMTWMLLRAKFVELHTRFFGKGARSS